MVKVVLVDVCCPWFRALFPQSYAGVTEPAPTVLVNVNSSTRACAPSTGSAAVAVVRGPTVTACVDGNGVEV